MLRFVNFDPALKMQKLYCRMLKLADKPSCLGGGDPWIKRVMSSDVA